MKMFFLIVTTFPLESFCSKIKWFKSIYRHYVDSILQKYFFSREGLPNSSISDNYGGIYRDKEYLRYKTYSPSRVIRIDRKSTRLNSSHTVISYAVFCLKKKT